MTEQQAVREAIRVLPDPHTDFIFSMDRGAALLAFALAVLLSFIVIQVVLRTRRGPDHER